MIEKLKKLDYKHKVTYFTFFLFLIIGFLSPISGDDWKYHVIGRKGILECFKNIDIKDGRIISGFLIPFFAYYKIIFNVVFALLISKFVSICNDLQGRFKTKYAYLHPLIGVLIVSTFMFAYNYVSVSSTVAYTFPAILFITYFYLLRKNDELNVPTIIKLFLISLIVTMSSIHIGIAFLVANLLYFVILERKTKNIFSFLLVITDLLLLIISMSLIKDNLVITDYKIIFGNVSEMIDSIFSNNILLIIVGAIPINLYLYEKLKEKTYGRVVITLFDIVLAFSLCYNFFNYVPFNINLILKKYSGIFATENWYYIFYFLTYIVLFIISVNHYIKNRKEKEIFNVLIASGILIMFFSLTSFLFDKGSIVLIILSLILITCVTLKDANVGIHVKIIKSLSFLLVIYYLSMFAVINYIDVTRKNYINEQLDYGQTVIEVKANPIYLVWRHNPVDYFQHRVFKEYYNIKEENTIEVKYFGVFERIEKRVKK